MRIGQKQTDERVFIIAEVGNNHEGNYSLAEELIGLAAETGADAVKFQTYVPERFVAPSEKERLSKLSSFQLSYDQFKSLAKVAEQEGILFLSTPFDLESARFLNTLLPAFKVASGDNNFYPLLELIAGFQKPILLSSGLSTLEEMRTAKNFIERTWAKGGKVSELAILHCVVSYPTPFKNANLNAIQALKTLGLTVGYSDHTVGIEASILSVAVGARIVEKHFTIRKNYSEYRDHQLSADPTDMRQMVERIRQTEELLGDGIKCVLGIEEKNAVAVRRSIIAANTIKRGQKITKEDLTWVRPGGGLPPGREVDLIDRVSKREIELGEQIRKEDVV